MTQVIDHALRAELDEVVAGLCRSLNDPKRVLILYALSDGAHTVSELCELLQIPQSNTSQHLAVLRNAGLTDTERRGSSVIYSLRHPKVIDAVNTLREIMSDEISRRQKVIST